MQSVDIPGGPAALHKRSESVTFPKILRSRSLHETVVKRGHFVPNAIESLAQRNQR